MQLPNEIKIQKLPTLFASINDIIKKGKTLGENPSDVPPRVICLLQDVLDLKKVSFLFQSMWSDRDAN